MTYKEFLQELIANDCNMPETVMSTIMGFAEEINGKYPDWEDTITPNILNSKIIKKVI